MPVVSAAQGNGAGLEISLLIVLVLGKTAFGGRRSFSWVYLVGNRTSCLRWL